MLGFFKRGFGVDAGFTRCFGVYSAGYGVFFKYIFAGL